MNQELPATSEKEVRPIKNPKMTKKVRIFLSALLSVSLIAGGVYAGISFQKNHDQKVASQSPSPTASAAQVSPEATNTASPSTTASPSFPSVISGKLTRLTDDLGLITNINEIAPSDQKVVYYTAGKITSGKYSGYTRVVTVTPAFDPSGAQILLLVTKDFKTYVVDGDPRYTTFDRTVYYNPLSNLKTGKVDTVDNIDSDHPKNISLDSSYLLYRTGMYSENIELSTKDSEGYNLTEEIIPQTIASGVALTSVDPNLKMYSQNNDYSQRTEEDVQTRYIKGSADILAVDSSGLIYRYTLTTKPVIENYLQNIEAIFHPNENIAVKGYNSADMQFLGSELTSSSQFYSTYSQIFPSCGRSTPLVVNNVSDSELSKIATLYGREIFILKNTNHELIKEQFVSKVTDYDDQTFTEMNKLGNKPTYQQYLEKNPVLFMKDQFGRLIVFGEYQYLTAGGCGKPVVYLYPETPTQVSVDFAGPMRLTTTMPFYAGGWKVLANPDGKLVDLQPEATDCSKINLSKFGLEYAGAACNSETYPYIYWAGQSQVADYPVMNEGWSVVRSDLSRFLNTKLDDVGLNAQEKANMLEYWLPSLLKVNSPYYRISFLNTRQMNTLAPMQITPNPDSLYRIFLDWQPLSGPISIEPQNLEHVVRNGFTVVEWGGLKR